MLKTSEKIFEEEGVVVHRNTSTQYYITTPLGPTPHEASSEELALELAKVYVKDERKKNRGTVHN